jgi:transposase
VAVIASLLPNTPRGVPRVDDRRVLNGIFWVLRFGGTVARSARALWPAHDLLQPLQSMAAS